MLDEILKENGCKGSDERSEKMSEAKNDIIEQNYQLKTDWLLHCVLVHNTQRNDASIIPGVIQNNPVSTDTKVLVKSRIDQNESNNTKNNKKG